MTVLGLIVLLLEYELPVIDDVSTLLQTLQTLRIEHHSLTVESIYIIRRSVHRILYRLYRQ